MSFETQWSVRFVAFPYTFCSVFFIRFSVLIRYRKSMFWCCSICVDSASIRVLVPMFTWKRIRKICDRKFIWLRSGHYYDHNGCERASGRVKRRANHHEKWASNFRYFCEKYLFIFADVSVLSFFTVSFWLCCCCSIVSLFRFDPISVGRFVFILHPLALSLSFFRVYFYRNWNIYFLLYSVFGLINCANSRTEKKTYPTV